MQGAPGRRARRPPRAGASVKSRRWDDPDSDDDGEDDQEQKEARLEKEHARWADDAGGDEDSESEEAWMKGSDSDGEHEEVPDAELPELVRRAPKPKPKGADDGLWDPLADLGPRKKRKIAAPPPGANKNFDFVEGTTMAGIPEGATVCLVGLLKAPQLNGKVGIIASPVDGATGRCQVLLEDGAVKSLRQDNMREVLTGAVVRLRGLQAAAELNGRLGECGSLDLSSQRYSVTLADGNETLKKVKADNVELVRRFIRPVQMLSTQRRPFEWKEVLARFRERACSGWVSQLSVIRELGLPAPQFAPAEALVRFAERCGQDSKGARASLVSDSMPADKAPIDGDGKLACRLLAVSFERDACCPQAGPRDEELRRLGLAAGKLAERDAEPFYFLLPTLCVKPLPCLRASASCAWPLYLQLCQALLSVESEHRAAKAWCRTEQLIAGSALAKPVYLLPVGGMSASASSGSSASPKGNEGWLLSNNGKEVALDAPANGQVLPAERALLEKMATEVLAQSGCGWLKGTTITCYRL